MIGRDKMPFSRPITSYRYSSEPSEKYTSANLNKVFTSSPRRRRVHYQRRTVLRSDIKAVSEALGTILLLAISIVLVSVVAVWLNSIPQEEERPQVKFVATYDSDADEVTITHRGGEVLAEKDVRLQFIRNSVTQPRLTMADGGLDSNWNIGEKWTYPDLNLGSNEELEVMVLDIRTNTVLLDQVVQEGTAGALVDLAVKDEEIEFDYSGVLLTSTTEVNITVKLYNLGNTTANDIIIRFFANTKIISDNSNEFLIVSSLAPTGTSSPLSLSWTWVPGSWGKYTIYVKVYTSQREISYANNYASKSVDVEFTEVQIQGKDLEITTSDITFFPTNPTRGIDVQLSIRVHNVGDEPVRKGERVWIMIYDITNSREIGSYNITNGISALGYHDWTIYWKDAGPGGTMNLSFEADYGNALAEIDETNNIAYKSIQVMPKILVVDDDGWAGGEFEVRHYLSEALTASGVTYDLHTVVASDPNDPAYTTGAHPLNQYDIIIWVTGYQSTKTLTAQNIETIKMAIDNGTYFWLIGQDVLDDIWATQQPFVENYLGVAMYNNPVEGTPTFLDGKNGDPISDGLTSLRATNYVSGDNNGDSITVKSAGVGGITESAGILNNVSKLGAGKAVATRLVRGAQDSKVVFFAWEFSALNDPGERAELTFRVMNWFGWKISLGIDFAIVSEDFSAESTQFMEIVEITAKIRNNGPTRETIDVEFYVTGSDGREKRIPNYIEDEIQPDNLNPTKIEVDGYGGTNITSKKWLANSLGTHSFRVMVDPYNNFQEVSEDNNDITYSTSIGTNVFVQHTILVVDDNHSAPSYIYFEDDMESGTNGWTHLNIDGDADEWELGAPNPGVAGGGPTFAKSGTSVWGTDLDGFYDDDDGAPDSYALVSPGIDISNGTNVKLSFWHWHQFQYDSINATGVYWDGGIVEVTTNETVWYQISPVGGYARTLGDGDGSMNNPLEGLKGYGRNSENGWKYEIFDLSPYKGNTIKIRYRIGMDEWTGSFGWYIDDFKVFESKNVVEMMTDSIELLGYEFDYTFVAERTDNGPDINKLKKYNTVIWMTGNETSNTITSVDEQSITAYLEGNYWETKYLEDFVPNVWFIGQDILEDITGGVTTPDTSTFAGRYLKVSSYSPDVGLPSNIKGVYHDDFTHGIDYPVKPLFGDSADAIKPVSGATGIFWADRSSNEYFGLRYSGRDYNLIFLTFEFGFIKDTLSFATTPSTSQSGAQVLFSDGFESGYDGESPPSGWVEVNSDSFGTNWATRNVNPKTGTYSARVESAFINPTWMRLNTTQKFDLTGKTGITLSFDWYVKDATGTNGLYLDLYYNSVWNQGVESYTASTRSSSRLSSWIHKEIQLENIPGFTKTTDFNFGFRWDGTGFLQEGYVDNIYLNASTSSGGGGGSSVSTVVYYKPELAFLGLNWFGYEDNRIELKTSTIDISLSNQNPMVGNSYVIKSEVYNYGGNDTSTIVRFMDGNTIIDTKSLHIAAGGKSAIEVIWNPLYVGIRNIVVDVDPDLDLKRTNGNWLEIFRFNNRAVLPKYVYFFFDDMENGTANWDHDSTIVNINGESKLDYTDGTDVDIISDWDWNRSSSKWIHDFTSSHTMNSAFSIMEPEGKAGVRKPIDAVLQVDSSTNMVGSKWTNLKLAIHAFINVLESVDRIAINTYGKGGSINLDWIRMGEQNVDMSAEPGWSGTSVFDTGRDVAKYFVDDLNLGHSAYPQGGSPLWKKIGESIHQANTTRRAEAMPFVLALADAANTAKGGFDPDINYTGDKTGLLNAPFTVYTILLGEPGNTEHDPNYDNNDQDTAPRDQDGWKEGGVRYNSKDHYDMWNIARSSDPSGKHYYIDDSSSLVNLFEFIAEEIKIQSSGVTRAASVGGIAGTNARQTSARHVNNLDILLVDDDGSATTGSPAIGLEEVWYRALMNFTSWGITVTNNSGPASTATMTGYDLVIWVAGHGTITNTEETNIMNYLDAGGKILLAGTQVAGGLGNTIVTGYFGTQTGSSTTTTKPQTLSGSGGSVGPWESSDIYQIVDPGGYTGSDTTTLMNPSATDSGKSCLEYSTGNFGITRKEGTDFMTNLWGIELSQVDGNITKNRLIGESLAWFSGNRAPNAPVAPYPSHSQEQVSHYPIIQWSNAGDPDGDDLLYDVYFGTTNPPPLVSFRQYGNYYDPGKLLGNTQYYWQVAASDSWRNTLSSPVWEFLTDIGAGKEGIPPGAAADIGWNNLTSPSFSISGASRAALTFYQRYNLYPALNGGIITIGLNNSGTFEYYYVVPTRPYPSNLLLSATLPRDDSGAVIQWAYNGKSGEGTFGWEYVEINLLTEGTRLGVDFTSDDIRVRFCYYRFGGGVGGGWWIDDVKVTVSASQVTSSSSDVWQLVNTSGHHSQRSWWNGDPSDTTQFKPGIDNSLYTRPIDLTNARSVQFECYLKFNINSSAGTPPDGFRIEISDDHGITWKAINKGVRTAWGVSGDGTGQDGSTDPYYDDGVTDGMTYPGIDPDGDDWVNTTTLTRLNTDISGWAGRVIMIRFRVVTTNDPAYLHRDDAVAWGGLFIDDVKVKGTSILAG